MRIEIGNGLIPLNVLVFLLIAAIIFLPFNTPRIVLGIPILLFFPGYSLVAALFPRKEGMRGIERVVVGSGMSIVVVPLIGLILNYTPWGISLESILYSVACFIFIASAIAWLRQHRLVQDERFRIEFYLASPGWGKGVWDKTLSITLVFVIIGALGMLGYALAMPKVKERLTEFYLVGLDDKATSYPFTLAVGEEAKVTVGIVNGEGKTVRYTLVVMISRAKNIEVSPILLEAGEKWEGEISFMPDRPGENQKVEFLLYKEDQAEPCFEPLRLWVDVREQ